METISKVEFPMNRSILSIMSKYLGSQMSEEQKDYDLVLLHYALEV